MEKIEKAISNSFHDFYIGNLESLQELIFVESLNPNSKLLGKNIEKLKLHNYETFKDIKNQLETISVKKEKTMINNPYTEDRIWNKIFMNVDSPYDMPSDEDLNFKLSIITCTLQIQDCKGMKLQPRANMMWRQSAQSYLNDDSLLSCEDLLEGLTLKEIRKVSIMSDILEEYYQEARLKHLETMYDNIRSEDLNLEQKVNKITIMQEEIKRRLGKMSRLKQMEKQTDEDLDFLEMTQIYTLMNKRIN